MYLVIHTNGTYTIAQICDEVLDLELAGDKLRVKPAIRELES
jgi:hypothetical protein